jgi:hypothetical protein
MKIFTSLMFFFLLIIPASFAQPAIESVKLEPENIWLGESLKVTVNCTGNVTSVYANVTGPGYSIPSDELVFALQNGLYSLTIDNSYLDRAGNFNMTIFCSGNETVSHLTSFKVSTLSVEITDISPSPAYEGEFVSVDVLVEKDSEPLSSNVNITLFLNGQAKERALYYDASRGFVLKFLPEKGMNNILVLISVNIPSYKEKQLQDSSSFEVKSPLMFDFVPEKSTITDLKELSLSLAVSYKGNAIPIDQTRLSFYLNSIQLEILSLSGNIVKVSLPTLSPGAYTLEGVYVHENMTSRVSRTVHYMVPVNIEMKNIDNKVLHATFIFTSGSDQKIFSTDSEGLISGHVPVDCYEIQVLLPGAKAIFYDVHVKSFENPFKYYTLGPFDVSGIRSAGTYVFEFSFPFEKASLEMYYDERYVLDEDMLNVYKCDNWNSGKRICNSGWEEIEAEIDKVRNLAKLEVETLSAFVIGSKKSIKLDYALDKQSYSLLEKIKVRGLALDEHNSPVRGAKISAKILRTGIFEETESDENGIFSLELDAPEVEGKYFLSISAELNPYLGFNDTLELEIVAKKEIIILLLVQSAIIVQRGGNASAQFALINSGQKTLENLIPSISGIPSSYFSPLEKIEKIEVGEEKKITVNFKVPENATPGSHTLTFKVKGEGINQEQIFSFIIEEKPEIKEEKEIIPIGAIISGVKKGNHVLNGILVILIGGFILKIARRLKSGKRKRRDDVLNIITGIKSEIKKTKI